MGTRKGCWRFRVVQNILEIPKSLLSLGTIQGWVCSPLGSLPQGKFQEGLGGGLPTLELIAEDRIPDFQSCHHAFAATVHKPGEESHCVEGDRWPQMRGE